MYISVHIGVLLVAAVMLGVVCFCIGRYNFPNR